jgi:outer membrane protein assembly factor BamB
MRSLLLLLAAPVFACADDWPQWMGPKRDNVWREDGILDKFPAGGPKVVWRTEIKGGYGGPAVSKGRVYVGDFVSDVKLDQEVYQRTNHQGTERLLCFDAATGKPLWKHEYPCRYTISFPNGPRATPTVDDGLVYFLGAEGNLSCLDAETGKPVWSKDFKVDYKAKTPLWGYAAHPFIDGETLYTTTGGEGACIVALDKKTGKEKWKALNPTEPGYGPPTIITAAGRRQLIVRHADAATALDPETGKFLWTEGMKASNGSAIMTPVLAGDILFIGGYSRVCKAMKIKADGSGVEVLWTGGPRTGLYPVNAQPFVEGDLIYGVCQNGELRCVDLKTGKRLWETLEPVGGTAAECVTAIMVKHADRYFLFNEKGELVIAKIRPKGYEELDRTKVIDPTGKCGGRDVVFSAPAYANKCMFVRNDKELVCVSLAKPQAANGAKP